MMGRKDIVVAVDGSWNPMLGRMGCAAAVRDKDGDGYQELPRA